MSPGKDRSAVLVTGGAGFIGSAVVRRLVEDGSRRVVNLDRLTYAGSPEAVSAVEDDPRYAFERVDVRDGAAVHGVLEEHDPDAVIHLAAASHVDRSIEEPPEFLGTNVAGTVVLLEAALEHWRGLGPERREAFRFLHVSTDEVYGDLADRGPEAAEPGSPHRFTELSRYAPNSPYAASKAASDHFVRAWNRTYGLPTLVTHGTNAYGPWQHPEKLIPHMLVRALEGRSLPLYGDGRHVRDWLHVEDHARALVRVLADGRPGEVYNVGGEEERTNLEVVRALCGLLDELRPATDGGSHRERIELVEDRPGHDRRYAVDAAKLREELGWSPRVGFAEGLRRTVAWYLEHGDWIGRVREEGYRPERRGLVG